MALTKALLALAATITAAHPAVAQGASPGQNPAAADVQTWTARVAASRPKPVALKPTGMCTVMRDGKIADQKSCAASKTAATGDTSYMWPSGNKTTVGGTDEDFTVNGNLAAPNASDDLGLCLFVEKTGNTFCYKEGAKPGLAAQVPAPAAAPPAQPSVGETAHLSTAAAAAPKSTDTALEDEARLRKAAEDRVRALEAEIAQLKDAEAKRAVEIKAAETEAARRSEEALQAKQSAEAKAAEILGEVDRLQVLCAKADEKACEQALSLMNEAVVTGAVDTTRRKELERLKRLASAPFGIPALSVLSGFPMSTWFASTLAALLGLTLLLNRKRNTLSSEPLRDPVLITPRLDTGDLRLKPPPLPPQPALQPPPLAAANPAKDTLLAISAPALSGPTELSTGDKYLPNSLSGHPDIPTSPDSPPSSRTAYLLNMLLPGSGNAYYGQRAMSALLLMAILLALTTPFAPEKSMFLGLGFSIVTGIMAFFTAGESLLVGLPISLLLVLQPASAVVSAAVWLFALGASQFQIRSGVSARRP